MSDVSTLSTFFSGKTVIFFPELDPKLIQIADVPSQAFDFGAQLGFLNF